MFGGLVLLLVGAVKFSRFLSEDSNGFVGVGWVGG